MMPRSNNSSTSPITSSTLTRFSSACSARRKLPTLHSLQLHPRRSEVVVVEVVPEPGKQDRGIVHIDKDLAVAASCELCGPTGLVVAILDKIRKMLLQSRAADADDRSEPV